MLYQIIPKKDYQFNLESLMMFFKNIGSTRKKKSIRNLFKVDFNYQYIIDCDKEGKINFYMEVNDSVNQDPVVNAINVWIGSKAALLPVKEQLKEYSAVDTLFDYEKGKSKKIRDKKLATFTNDSVFMNIIAMMQPKTRVSMLFKVTDVAAKNESGVRSVFRNNMDVNLECLIQVSGDTKYSRTDVMNIANSICSLTAAEKRLSVKYKNVFEPVEITGNELANLIQLPTLYRKEETEIERINYMFTGQETLKDGEYASGIYAGTNYHPIQSDRKVYIGYDTMRTHAFVSGTTGSGKSAAVEEWIDGILHEKMKNINASGFTFLDPLESSVLGVIDKILKLKADGYDISELLKRVKYIDLSTDQYIFPISLLNSNNSDPTDTIDFFRSLYGDQNTIQVDRMMSSALKTLLEDTKEHSIFDVQEIFNPADDTFRQQLITRLSNDIYASEEVKFLKNTRFNQSIADPILNRLDPFKNSRKKRLMFGLPQKYDCTSQIRKWMDEGYIVLFNLKGLSVFDVKVIIGYLSTQYYRQALTRPDFSLLHMLIVDEAHKVQMPIFPKMTAELRKPGLALVTITQFVEQFDVEYSKQLMGNINTFVSFKQKEAAANILQRSIPSGDVAKTDLMQLPQLVGYLSTVDSKKERSILIKVRPPFRYNNGKLVDHNNQKEIEKNIEKNRKFAYELMARDFFSREEAEKIVYRKQYDMKELDEIEQELLEEGDSLVVAEDSEKIRADTKEGGTLFWEK